MAIVQNGLVFEDPAYAAYVDLAPTSAPYVLDFAGYNSLIFQFSWNHSVLPTGDTTFSVEGSLDPAMASSYVVYNAPFGNPGTQLKTTAARTVVWFFPIVSGGIVLPVTTMPRYLRFAFDPNGQTAVGTIDVKVAMRR